jgi:alginate O-acetyltransferase complex protein AlgJ
MGLLAGYRRYWCLLWLALLVVPLAVQLLQPAATASEEEVRILSTAPAWPHTARDWLALPRALDRFLGDHFGLRTGMVRVHARLRYAADLPSDLRVTIGRDNWLFLNGDGTIEQATGKLLRVAEIARFADRAAALRKKFAARGARLLAAVPPNGPTRDARRHGVRSDDAGASRA